jgi:hypothetical protein
LRADQQALDLLIIDGRVVAARAEADLVTRAAKQLGRSLLQTSGGNPELENVWHGSEQLIVMDLHVWSA